MTQKIRCNVKSYPSLEAVEEPDRYVIPAADLPFEIDGEAVVLEAFADA